MSKQTPEQLLDEALDAIGEALSDWTDPRYELKRARTAIEAVKDMLADGVIVGWVADGQVGMRRGE